MEIYRSSVFANQLKTLLKTDWEKFQELLCDELENNRPKMPEMMSEVGEFKIVKRRIANPMVDKGKSQGFPRVVLYKRISNSIVQDCISIEQRKRKT